MQIYDINDNLIYDAPLTEGCERVQELMAADHIQLSFKAVHSFTIPAGAYIDWFGIYRLLEPYTPTQQSEAEYLYTPQFHAEHITWKKYPFFFYTDEKAEPDWSLTGNATLFLDCVTMALQKTFGQSWHYSVASDLPASAYVAFQNTDIFSGLNAIAEAFKTEWYADLTENRIYLGHVSRDEQAVLEVGKNVNVPSVAANSDAYFNRFYAFGSTRNIPQNYVGANTQNVVNKRLTLDPAKYPDGYKDIKDLKSGEEFATNLFFDNIYPRATEGTEGSKGLAISNVRERRLFKVERGTTNKIPTGETDENGNPIYEMYSIWYFNIASLELSKSMIIEGTDLTCSFESGALQGREFVLGYHEEDQKLETADGTPFYVYAGDYEILYVEENGITIPTTGVGLIPADGDEVALFNLELPDSYVEIAYKELEDALDEEMARRQKDYNSYTFKSNPVAFAENNPNLYLGRAVKFINSGKALDTRITKLTYKLDSESSLFPNEMSITIGEKRIKRSVATLKEEVVNANRNIDLLAALNKQTTTIQEAYKRTQDAILQGFNRIANMWQFDDEGNVYSEFNVYTLKALSSKGISANEGGTGGTGIDIARMWEELASDDATKLINLSHMPSSVKTAVNWVSSVTGSDADSQINKWNEIVSFLSGISDTSSLSSILSGKANTSAVEELSDDVSALSTHITNILARKVNAGTGLTGGGTLNDDVTLSLATIGKSGTYTKVIVDAYGRVTGSSTLLESDIPYLSIAKISNLQSTIDTINGKFLNYLSLSGGKMANTNLVTNLNADLLDGVHLADVYRKSGWYRVVPYINNGGIVYHYWFKVAQINYTTTSGLAELELAAVSDANYMYSASARLTIKGYSDNPSCSVSLTSNAYLSTRINVALDKDGGVWVKSNCSWSSYLRWRAIVNDEGYTGITILDGSTKQLDQPINSCVIEENTGATYRQSKDAFETAWAAFDVGIGSFKSYSAQIKILPYNDSAYIEFGNADFTNNVPAFITGYSSNPLNLLTISSHSTIFTGSVTIGGANGVTLSFDATNDMLKFSKGGYFLGAVSTKGVSAETGTGGSGVALSTVWDSLANNTDAYGSTKIHLDHIPTLTTSKISDFPTLVSAFANDAGYITASAIINKADKATTIQGYGLWEKYSDLNDAPMGAFFCGGNSVANSPESGNYISGITLAKDKNAQFRTQLGFVNNRIFTRQESGANNWSQWRELAFLGDVAKKATTLAGYGITDAIPYLETSAEIKKVAIGYGYYDAGFASSGGFISAIHHGGKYGFQLNATNTGSDIWYRGLNNGTFTEWKRIAFLDDVVTLSGNQTITGEKVFQTGGGSNVPLRIRNTADSAHIQAGSSGTNNTASLTISGLSGTMLTSLQVYATNTSFHGSISTTKISGITDSSVVANLHAQYSTNLKGDDNRNVNEAPYSYGTCAVNWRFKRAKAIGLATNDYEYAGVLHLTPWNDSKGGPDHQLAFESNGKIKYRSGLSTWSDWTELLTDANGVTLGTEQIVTGHKTFKNDGYYTSIFNSTLSDGKVRLLLMNNGEAKLMLAYDGLGSSLYDYGSAQTLRIQNDGDLLFTKSIIASSQLKSNVATGTSPLAVNSTTMVANLNANYLGGLNKDSFQKAVYDYVNVVGTANDTALPTVLAPSIYNGTNSIGGNLKYYDTKFYNGRSNTSNRCQLAYGYDVDSIHFRRYKDGTWYDWKKVVFTEGEDNIQVTNAYARFTANNGSLSGFFGFSGNVIGAYSTSLAEWLISASTSAICIAPQGKVNVGVKTWTPAYDFHVNGSIGANSLTIGQATISWDSTNQMLKVNTGAYFLGPVSTKGVSNGSGLVAVAQFGITWHDAWAIDANSTYVESFGTTNKSISDGQGTTNGSTITIVSDAFAGKKIGDIEIFTLGWENEAPANVRLAPYKISGNTLYCSLLLSGTMSQATFKIKIY